MATSRCAPAMFRVPPRDAARLLQHVARGDSPCRVLEPSVIASNRAGSKINDVTSSANPRPHDFDKQLGRARYQHGGYTQDAAVKLFSHNKYARGSPRWRRSTICLNRVCLHARRTVPFE